MRVLLLTTIVFGAGLVSLQGGTDPPLPDHGDAVRKGRPRTQVTFKGSSPYFKVNFDRYTGVVSCVWCHPKATEIWRKEEQFHVNTFSRLDEDARKLPKCVKCHVTAYNRKGVYPFEDEAKQKVRKLGYTMGGDPDVNQHFLGVQCEACHGPNCGNKYSKERLVEGCRKCHNEESPHFKGFEPEKALARLKHAEVGAFEKIDYNLYTGLDGCFMCHRPNFEAWRRDQKPHADAYAVLDEKGRQDPKCLKCHTTGFHQDGFYPLEEKGKERSRRAGFAFGGDPAENRRFEGVQCEACHGINCGTYTTVERIKPQCVQCHSGECANDKGFDWERDYAKVKHKPPADYVPAGEPKVIIEWYDWGKGLETAKAFRIPLLVVLSNPPDG